VEEEWRPQEVRPMIAYELKPPVEALGWRMENLEDAAYVVRKYVIETDDAVARRLVRFMRDAQTMGEAAIAEARLRAWAVTVKAAAKPGRAAPAKSTSAGCQA
jgi:hypothetical protein